MKPNRRKKPNYFEFINKLALLRQEAFDLGLIKTYQKFDAVIKEVGWERAEQLGTLHSHREK